MRNAIRLLIVTSRLDVGGAERHLYNVLPRLAQKGFDIDVFVLHKYGVLNDDFKCQGINIIEPTFKFPQYIDTLYSVVQLVYTLLTKKPNVINSFLPEPYIVSGIASFFFVNIKKIMSRRSLNDYQKNRPLLIKFEKFLHKRMDHILANSGAIIEQLIEEGCDQDKITLVYNGVNTKLKVPDKDVIAIKSRLKISQDEIVIIVIANLIPYKGHKVLFEALNSVNQNSTNKWRLLCVGRDDGIQSELETMAESYGIENKIEFLGSVKRPEEYMAISDVGVLTSFQEGFSNSILECMSFSLPMVVTDVGGNKEAVRNNNNGFVVPSGDFNSLAERLLDLLDNPDLRKSMGASSRQIVEEEFDIEICVDKYNKLYRTIANSDTESTVVH